MQQKQQQRYDQGYDHLKQKLSNEISHISEITRLDAKETQTAAIRLAGDSNVRLHRRHSEMSIYHDPDFRHGAQQAVRNFVSESREAYKQTQIQTQRMGVG